MKEQKSYNPIGEKEKRGRSWQKWSVNKTVKAIRYMVYGQMSHDVTK